MKNFGELASEVRQDPVMLEEGKKSLGTGWMLKADPKLGKAVKDKIDLAKKRQATYGDKSAGKSIKEENIEEGKRGLWDNIHAKRERIKSGSGERMRKPGSEGAPSEKDLKNSQTNEEVEQLDEMPGANMDTRAVHQHLKKRGWKLSRTSGSHDVYTHPDAKHHIPVPRHRQLKAPLVKGIMKQAEINEQQESDTTQKTEMAQTQLHFMMYAAEEILEFIEMGGEIEEWYQNKLSKVMSDIESLHSYVEGESRRTGMKEDVEQIDEISDKTLQSYRSKAHTQIQHYKYAGGKDKPEASSVLAKREPGMATATTKVIQKAKDRAAAQPKREPQKMASYKPLGGRDEKSGRSYSESVDNEPFNYDEWKKSKVKPRKPRGYKDAEAIGQQQKEIDRERKDRLKKQKQQIKPVKESDASWAASMEKQKENRLTAGDKKKLDQTRALLAKEKKPMKPAPIVTSEQTATDLGKERREVPFDGPYVKNTAKVTTDKSGAQHTAMSRVKHLAKTAARKQAGLKEAQEPEDSFEKTSTPAKRSLSKTAGIVKDLAKNSKSSSKEKADTFQAEPELSSQIIKT